MRPWFTLLLVAAFLPAVASAKCHLLTLVVAGKVVGDGGEPILGARVEVGLGGRGKPHYEPRGEALTLSDGTFELEIRRSAFTGRWLFWERCNWRPRKALVRIAVRDHGETHTLRGRRLSVLPTESGFAVELGTSVISKEARSAHNNRLQQSPLVLARSAILTRMKHPPSTAARRSSAQLS